MKRSIFKKVDTGRLQVNPFQEIGKEGMLIAAGDIGRHNMMTASWGAVGVLWHKNVVFCFVRPVRYTFEFMEANACFTLNFFEKRYKKVLAFCGAKSGRDIDKTKAAGLTPVAGGRGIVYFGEARRVIVARKIYFQDIEPRHFLDGKIEGLYPAKDYHRMYVGEIVSILER
jgi:flavin reductase (DIM6/NTAB) family NADH-FMN oxidoreductase RutF